MYPRFTKKRLFISCLFMFYILVLSCCSEETPIRRPSSESLSGTIWTGNIFQVIKNSEGGYQLDNGYPVYFGFYPNGEFHNTPNDNYPGKYLISNDILIADGLSYKISKYTGSELHLIALSDLDFPISKESGYGFRRIIKLRKY